MLETLPTLTNQLLINNAIAKLRVDLKPSRVVLSEQIEERLQAWENGDMLRQKSQAGAAAQPAAGSAAVPTAPLQSKTSPVAAAVAAEEATDASHASGSRNAPSAEATPPATPCASMQEPAVKRSLADRMRSAKRRC